MYDETGNLIITLFTALCCSAGSIALLQFLHEVEYTMAKNEGVLEFCKISSSFGFCSPVDLKQVAIKSCHSSVLQGGCSHIYLCLCLQSRVHFFYLRFHSNDCANRCGCFKFMYLLGVKLCCPACDWSHLQQIAVIRMQINF